MPQLQLPIFPAGINNITPELGFECRDGKVTYFLGLYPVFFHEEKDVATFRMITSQFIVNGRARNVDIARAFGVSSISVKRAVARYRAHGAAGFFQPRKPRGPAVLTPEVMERLQERVDSGEHPREAARALGLKPDTVSKAVRAGRLRVKKKDRGRMTKP